MAINQTGAIYKSLEFDGESSRTYGVYITGAAVYNAPTRDVEMIAIPGRNGAFALDRGRFENITVTYPAGIFADTETDFAKAISDFRNFLCSRSGYCRLTDEYNPNEYRLAVYKSGLEVEPALLRAGEFEIVFECKPQRWLTSGESAVTVGEWSEWETESGPIVEIEASETDKVKSLSVALEPIQDLHGYDKPWSGGAGANKWDEEWEVGGIDPATGANVGSSEIRSKNYIEVLPNTAYYCHVGSSAGQTYNIKSRFYDADKNYIGTGGTWKYNGAFTIPSGAQYLRFAMQPEYGTTYNHDIAINYPSSVTTYEPYSNICPISGRTECEVYVSPTTSETDAEVYTTSLGRTVYGGTLEQVGGQLTDSYAMLDLGTLNWAGSQTLWSAQVSLNHTNGTPAICSQYEDVGNISTSNMTNGQIQTRSNYVFICDTNYTDAQTFKTAMSGVQLCYELSTPTTYQLTPTEVALLKGNNNVWSDGDVTLEYGQDPNVIVNPTLFEASPLLEVDGYGNIQFNGYDIDIENVLLGDVVVSSTWEKTEYGYQGQQTYTINFINTSLLNAGDAISLNGAREVYQITLPQSNPQNVVVTYDERTNLSVTHTLSKPYMIFSIALDSFSIQYGTSSTWTAKMSGDVTMTGGGVAFAEQITFTYSGGDSINITTRMLAVGSSRKVSLPTFIGDSTQPLTETKYIDCEAGEAYLIHNDETLSINNAVQLGSDLPKFAPGSNAITYDNTITSLNVVPRWWKI